MEERIEEELKNYNKELMEYKFTKYCEEKLELEPEELKNLIEYKSKTYTRTSYQISEIDLEFLEKITRLNFLEIKINKNYVKKIMDKLVESVKSLKKEGKNYSKGFEILKKLLINLKNEREITKSNSSNEVEEKTSPIEVEKEEGRSRFFTEYQKSIEEKPNDFTFQGRESSKSFLIETKRRNTVITTKEELLNFSKIPLEKMKPKSKKKKKRKFMIVFLFLMQKILILKI